MVAATCIRRRSSSSASSHSAMCSARSRSSAGVDLAEQARRPAAHRDGARTERLDDEAVAGELVGARDQPLDVGLVELDDLGDQQDLAGDAALLQRRLHALVDEPLVRRVLIDDDDAVAGLGDDVGLVHLGARGTERAVDLAGRDLFGTARARLSAEGAPTSKARCAGDGEARARRARALQSSTAARCSGRAGPARRASAPRSIRPRRSAQRRERCGAAGGRGALGLARQRLLEHAHDRGAHQAEVMEATSALAGCTLT